MIYTGIKLQYLVNIQGILIRNPLSRDSEFAFEGSKGHTSLQPDARRSPHLISSSTLVSVGPRS